MSKIALITGITGQDGPYLARVLLNKGYTVFGMVRNIATPNVYGLDFLGIKDKIQLVFGDLNYPESVEQTLSIIAPDEIYHLAAQSSVIDSWKCPLSTFKTNADATIIFLEYVKTFPLTKLFLAQSSEMFGKNPVNHETKVFDPSTPYGVAKLFSYHLGKLYREKFNLFIVNGILYIHESPLRNINFFFRKVSQTVAKISLGLEKELVLGNVDLYRDIGFVGDYMELVSRTLTADTARDYVIARGEYTLLRDLVRIAFAEVGITDFEAYVRFEPNYFRKDDPVKVKGSPGDIFDKLDFQLTISPEDIMRQMVQHDLELLRSGSDADFQYAIPKFH